MTPTKKFAALAIASLSIAVASVPSAEAAGGRNRNAGLIAAGLIGGALLGAAMSRPAQAYVPAQVQPVYDSEQECIRKVVGYTYDGYPVRKTVCY